ncbi:MAG: DUF4932 domain-containing protein [Candidatus Cryptobacteroides sp.]
MKKILSLCLIAATLFSCQSGTSGSFASSESGNAIELVYDECIDLMAVVWRLAGAMEYSSSDWEEYDSCIDEYFKPYADHPAVQLAKEYRKSGVGYDAVVSYGAFLEIDADGNIGFDKSVVNNVDDRWTSRMQTTMLESLQAFYNDTDFHKWYETTEVFREMAMEEFSKLAAGVDKSWFTSFFSTTEMPKFRITVAPIIGCNNYGLSAITSDGNTILSPVMGSLSFDILIHEFCHPYCNPVIDNIFGRISFNARRFFKMEKALLGLQAYSSVKTMMYETLVRASVIKYLAAHDAGTDVQALVMEQVRNGFPIVKPLVENMKPGWTENDIVKIVKGYSVKKYRAEMQEYEKNLVHFHCNIEDGVKNIPAGDLQFTIEFDRPMKEDISIFMTEYDFPELKDYSWSEDQKTLTFNFVVSPSTTYGLHINGAGFSATDGTTAVDATVVFRTK